VSEVQTLRAGAVAVAGLLLQADTLPRASRVVIVIEENHSPTAILGNPDAPYLQRLAAEGAVFSNSFAIWKPSQPNYIALFSGSRHGVLNNSFPVPGAPLRAPNLSTSLAEVGETFAGFSEDLPSIGFDGLRSGRYHHRHNPWVNFANVPPASNRPFSDFPQGRFEELPTVSMVIPNLDHDMHDGTIAEADAWLEANLGPFVEWAKVNDGLLIVTWDEGNQFDVENRIPTIFVGGRVRPGVYPERIDHYRVLRTVQEMFGATPTGHAAEREPITSVWEARPASAPASEDDRGCGLLGLDAFALAWAVVQGAGSFSKSKSRRRSKTSVSRRRRIDAGRRSGGSGAS
jgi:phosphatidylinositol-3-phosphatase